ncbi:MAG: hypothetical protein ABIG95_04025 [Candidatus Woesearchaeota archaeon]
MVSITLSVPQDLKEQMDLFPEINWSAVARTAILRKIAMLNKFQMFVRDSDFTEEDAFDLGGKVNKKLAKRYK